MQRLGSHARFDPILLVSCPESVSNDFPVYKIDWRQRDRRTVPSRCYTRGLCPQAPVPGRSDESIHLDCPIDNRHIVSGSHGRLNHHRARCHHKVEAPEANGDLMPETFSETCPGVRMMSLSRYAILGISESSGESKPPLIVKKSPFAGSCYHNINQRIFFHGLLPKERYLGPPHQDSSFRAKLLKQFHISRYFKIVPDVNRVRDEVRVTLAHLLCKFFKICLYRYIDDLKVIFFDDRVCIGARFKKAGAEDELSISSRPGG